MAGIVTLGAIGSDIWGAATLSEDCKGSIGATVSHLDLFLTSETGFSLMS